MYSHTIIHLLTPFLLALPSTTTASPTTPPIPNPPSLLPRHKPVPGPPVPRPLTGADAFACLFLPDFPVGALPMAVHFEAGLATQCMRVQGHAAEMLVKKPGTTCTSIGWVQPEYAGNCETQNSMMNVSYSYVTGEKQERGMTQTWWGEVAESAEDGGEGGAGGVGEAMNAMKLIAPNKDVIACTTGKMCRTPRRGRWDVTWRRGSKGPVYIIFKPQ